MIRHAERRGRLHLPLLLDILLIDVLQGFQLGTQRRDLTITFAQLFVHAFDRARLVHRLFPNGVRLETGRSSGR